MNARLCPLLLLLSTAPAFAQKRPFDAEGNPYRMDREKIRAKVTANSKS